MFWIFGWWTAFSAWLPWTSRVWITFFSFSSVWFFLSFFLFFFFFFFHSSHENVNPGLVLKSIKARGLSRRTQIIHHFRSFFILMMNKGERQCLLCSAKCLWALSSLIMSFGVNWKKFAGECMWERQIKFVRERRSAGKRWNARKACDKFWIHFWLSEYSAKNSHWTIQCDIK